MPRCSARSQKASTRDKSDSSTLDMIDQMLESGLGIGRDARDRLTVEAGTHDECDRVEKKGLLAGVAFAIKQVKPDVKVVGVQAEGASTYPASLEAGEPISRERMNTMADGIAIARNFNRRLAWARRRQLMMTGAARELALAGSAVHRGNQRQHRRWPSRDALVQPNATHLGRARRSVITRPCESLIARASYRE